MSQNVDPAIKDIHSNMTQCDANLNDNVEANINEILHHIRRLGESEPDYDFRNNNVPEDACDRNDGVPEDTSDQEEDMTEDISDQDDGEQDESDDENCIEIKPGLSFETKEKAIKASKKFLAQNYHPFIIASSGGDRKGPEDKTKGRVRLVCTHAHKRK